MADGSEYSDYMVAFSTAPSIEEARRIAHDVVENRLAACVNLVTGIVSVYEWEAEIHEDPEVLLVMKTREALVRRLIARIVEIHPYDCPEVVVLPILGGNKAYLDWIETVTGEKETLEESEP